MSECYESGRKKKKQILSEETKEKNRVRARNAYRQKAGIEIDADLIQRGGAHHVKYSSKEEAKLAKSQQQKQYRVENKEEIIEYYIKYRAEHKEEFSTYRKQKYQMMKQKKNEEKDVVVEQSMYACNMTRKEYNKNYYLKNKEKMNEQCKQNYLSKKVGNCSDCPEDSDDKPQMVTISQITNDLDEYMKKYKMSFNV